MLCQPGFICFHLFFLFCFGFVLSDSPMFYICRICIFTAQQLTQTNTIKILCNYAPPKSHREQMFAFACRAVICLHNLGEMSFSIKPSSARQTQLCCIMAGREAVKFHHLLNSVSYSTNKVQFDLFQRNSESRRNVFTISRSRAVIMQLKCRVTAAYAQIPIWKSYFYLIYIFILCIACGTGAPCLRRP